MISKYKSKVYAFQKGASVLKEATVFRLNPKFKYRDNLSALVLDYKSIDRSLLLSRLKGMSRVKLLLLSGIFIGDDKSRVDVLYVGEAIKLKDLEKAFAGISVELGRDIKYVIMDVEEFVYRQKMFDAFIVDIINGQNEILVDKLNKY